MKYESLITEEVKIDLESYYTLICAPKRVREDLRISMEQADNGELIPMDDVLARY